VVTLRFRGVTGADFTSDMALDGFSVSDVVGMNEELFGANVSVYPNPGNGHFNVNINNLTGENVELSVKDMLGREVQRVLAGSSGIISSQLDISAFAEGIYNLTISIGDARYAVKLINIK
jgi:hypothetical protein